MTSADRRILRFPAPAPRRLRLFCFPYAGGGAGVFRPWTAYLPPSTEICAIQPPGREGDFGSEPAASMRDLVDGIVSAMRPLLDGPFAFFGHSLGAIVAYETALAIAREGIEPMLLFASGHRAPHLPSPRPAIAHLPDDRFVHEVAQLGGMPAEVLENQEFLELVMPTLRADFRIAECYHPPMSVALRCPVIALGSVADYVSEEAIAAWRETTSGPFDWKMFPGDHFYINTERAALTAYVGATLDDWFARCTPGQTPHRT